MTTKKSTKTAKTATRVKKDSCDGKCIDPIRYRDMLIVALIALVVGITAAFTLHIQNLKKQLDSATCETIESVEEVEE